MAVKACEHCRHTWRRKGSTLIYEEASTFAAISSVTTDKERPSFSRTKSTQSGNWSSTAEIPSSRNKTNADRQRNKKDRSLISFKLLSIPAKVKLKMSFCKGCVYWERGILNRCGDQFGICHQATANTQVIQDRTNKVNDETVLYTAEFFGCVHQRTGKQTIITIEAKKYFQKKVGM